jgi:putative YhdH/YhfP family quinone oxidoreductase
LLATENEDGKAVCNFTDLTLDDLPERDTVVQVAYSTLNYKDGLALNGNRGKIMHSLPMIPGIDLCGTVISTDSPDYAPGDEVVITGWGLSEWEWGGYTQMARVNAEWLVKLPEGMTLQQSMAIGTAGFTAMLAVMGLENMDVTPDSGDILVTGAAGGVGSVAVSLLAHLGYNVVASTGREETHDYLKSLGASSFIGREELSGEPRAMARAKWAGAIDTVGSNILANVIPQIDNNGAISVCGNAAGFDLSTTVLPLILRGVSLVGINSVYVPIARRADAWRRLASELDLAQLDDMTTVIPFADLVPVSKEILKGQVRGRTVVDVNA